MNTSSARPLQPCLVCGDKSIGFNFGVLSCMACKAFFRRNAVKLGSYDFHCPKDGNCPITYTFRRICNCCRLAKCFRVGMQKELILTEAEKEARRQTVARNRMKREQALKSQSLDMVPVSTIQYLTPYQFSSLSRTDQVTLGNVLNAYESTCIVAKNFCLPEFPQKKHTSLSEFLNEYSLMHKFLIEFFKVIPEFGTLSIQDKICLIRNQFGVVNNINEAIVHPGISDNLVVSSTNIYGPHITNRLIKSIQKIAPFANDPIILKLLLIVVAFSSGNCRNRNDCEMDQICNDTFTVFVAQNVYVELLWKYISSCSSSHVDVVKFFSKLVQFLLYLLDVHLLIDGYINSLCNEIDQMEPLMQSMWPKPATNSGFFIDTMEVEHY